MMLHPADMRQKFTIEQTPHIPAWSIQQPIDSPWRSGEMLSVSEVTCLFHLVYANSWKPIDLRLSWNARI